MRVEKQWSIPNYMTQQAAVAVNENGVLALMVRISISKAHVKPSPFRPRLHKNNGVNLFTEILDTGKTATQSFSFVIGKDEKKVILHLPTRLCEQRLPLLWSLLKREGGGDAEEGPSEANEESIEIKGLLQDMTLESFRMFLFVAFTGNAPEPFVIQSHVLNLLDLSDRFGFIELKIFLEAHLSLYHMVDVASAVHLLSIAHARNCALLREQCIDFLHGPHIFPSTLQYSQWNELITTAPDVLQEVYQRMGRTQPNALDPPMSISEIYMQLEIKGLDLDGARMVLEARIKETSLSAP